MFKATLLLVLHLRLLCAQDSTAAQNQMASEGPVRYSEAILRHKSPELLLAEREEQLKRAQSDPEKAIVGAHAAKSALEANHREKAQKYAEDALGIVAKLSQRKGDVRKLHADALGDPTFYAHLVLGHLALLRGDVESANQELLLAGQTTGSPGLNNFGPNMSLARELLIRSQKETVLKFLEECGAFWTFKDAGTRLMLWAGQIRNDSIPEFGPNLFY